MPQKYRVHIIAAIRIPVDVCAESETEAITLAEQQTHIPSLLRGPAADDENLIEFGVDCLDRPDVALKMYSNDGITRRI